VNAVGENAIEVSDGGGKAAKLEMDPATGLPAKLIVEAIGPQGKMAVERQYSDWREVNGVKFPFKTVILQGGKPAGTTISETISTNTGVSIEEIMKK
jgi:hypothetical protein